MTEPDDVPFPPLTAEQLAYFAEKKRRLEEAIRAGIDSGVSDRSIEEIIEDARKGFEEGKRPFVSEDSMTRPGPPPPPLTPDQAAFLDAQDQALIDAIQEGADDIVAGRVEDWSVDEIRAEIYQALDGTREK